MKKKILLNLILGMLILYTYAGDGSYNVSKIPTGLTKEADAIMRVDETRFELVSIGKAKLYRKYAITVLNENGIRFARFHEYYSKLFSIESIDGTLYDSTGKKIQSLKKSDITDVSGGVDATEIDDVRYKLHSFYSKSFPYTVEYEIEEKYNMTMIFPDWEPIQHLRFAVEQSSMTVICPKDYLLRYKPFNYPDQPAMQEDNSSKSYTWEIKNFPGIIDEYASPETYEITPSVYFGPSKFKVGDYEGDMTSWQDYGKFIYALKQGRDELPDNIKTKVHQLTDNLKDDKEKVRALYEMMQNSTRYISIQLGIGGWQPLEAKFVAAKGYGDCKALTNYMYSLLHEAGIKSCYTLVKSGDFETSFFPDFPSHQFNHVILCVPIQKDTVWLECTSQIIQPGYLGKFTADRPVMVVDEGGGTLVKTPKYGIDENLELRKVDAVIDSTGQLLVNINTVYQGLQQDELFDFIHSLSKDKVMEILKRGIDLPQYDVSSFNYSEKKEGIPSINEKLEISASNYAAITGKRMFLIPNIISRWTKKILQEDKRRYPIVFNYEYRDIDSAIIKIPSGYKPESVPGDLKLESKFGKYTASVKIEGDKVYYYRKMEKYSGEFPAADFADLVKFYDQIYKADHTKVVLVKN